ncbi:MAG: MBL fold metallo-hydrolase [Deltaproteobacteria bacterium]|nr:MBL fold metallo-hydrolase [Deltaproteobacteria bacterium]
MLVDPSGAPPVLDALHGLVLDAVWCTHHHPDHAGGVAGLPGALDGAGARSAGPHPRRPRLRDRRRALHRNTRSSGPLQLGRSPARRIRGCLASRFARRAFVTSGLSGSGLGTTSARHAALPASTPRHSTTATVAPQPQRLPVPIVPRARRATRPPGHRARRLGHLDAHLEALSGVPDDP